MLSPVVSVHVMLPELAGFAQHVITKRRARIGCVELKFTGGDRAVLEIHVCVDEARSDGNLMISAHDADVIRELRRQRVCETGRSRLSVGAEAATYIDKGDLGKARLQVNILHSNVTE